MIELSGKYNTAKVFTNNVEETAISQIIELCNQEFVEGSKIRIMPDVHSGAGCVIGTTMEITTKVVANLVGVDIGCGLLYVNLGKISLDLPNIDWFIKNKIPHGFGVNKITQARFDEIESLICLKDLLKTSTQFEHAIGSLGGGNHFIEINMDKEGNYILVIHSGSRNMGLQIAKYYQDKAFQYHNGIDESFEDAKKKLIVEFKETGKSKQIPNALDVLKKEHRKESKISKDLCYVEKEDMQNYLHDLGIAQRYASLSRRIMAQRIINEGMGLIYSELEQFETIHNYIELDTMMLRKGAVSAKEGETLIIPINMRDGSLICRGKGNADWNYSAPHGAGRLMSRTAAKEKVSLDEFKNSMSGIYTSSVGQSTLDEAPMVYKPLQEIVDNIQDTVDVIDIIKPIYNFKSGG